MDDKPHKKFSYVVVSRILSSATRAIFFLIFATILTPADYGLMGYLIALGGMFSIMSRFGLPQTTIVYRAKGKRILSNQVNLLAIISASTASIILLFINEFSALLCLGLAFFFLYQHNLLGEKKYKDYMKNAILRNIVTFVFSFALYFVLDVPGILLGMALGNIIGSILLIKYINLSVKSFQLLKQNYKVLISNFGIDASNNLVYSVDRLLVSIVFGFVFAGSYVFIMQILFALELLPRSLYQFLLSEESSDKQHKKLAYLVVLTSVLITIAVIIFSSIVVEQVFPNYSNSIPSLQILVVSLIPLSISFIIVAKMQVKESTQVGYSGIVRIGTLLVLLGVLGSIYDLIGMSVAVLVSVIVNTVFLYFLYQRQE